MYINKYVCRYINTIRASLVGRGEELWKVVPKNPPPSRVKCVLKNEEQRTMQRARSARGIPVIQYSFLFVSWRARYDIVVRALEQLRYEITLNDTASRGCPPVYRGKFRQLCTLYV